MSNYVVGDSQHILVIDQFLPLFDRNSGSHRLMEILKMLVGDGHKVTFLSMSHIHKEEYQPSLEAMGIRVIAGDASRMAELANSEIDPTIPNLDIEAELTQNQYDTALISFHSVAALYIPQIRQWSPDTRIVVDSVDLHFVRERRGAELSGDPKAAEKAEDTYTKEISTYRQADALIAITDVERDILLGEMPDATVFTLPNIHELEPSRYGFEERYGMVFAGNFWHAPNAEGIAWFCEEVWPLVRAQLPSASLDIVGSPAPDISGSGIHVLGWVPSMQPHLSSARVSIAPLLTGAGMKGKVGEAFASGLPVVTTSIGAEGIGINDGTHAMIGDDPQTFADAILEVHTNAATWERLSRNGLDLIRRNYTPSAVRGALRKIVPPTDGAPLRMMATVDWNNVHVLRRLVQEFVESFGDSPNTSLEVAIIDDEIDPNKALELLLDVLGQLGHDPDNIPDLSLTPLSNDQLESVTDVLLIDARA